MMYGGAMMTRSQNKQQQLEQAKDVVIQLDRQWFVALIEV